MKHNQQRTIPLSSRELKRRDNRLKKLRSDQTFIDYVRGVSRMMRDGNEPEQIREHMAINDYQLWSDILCVISQAMTKESLFMEWHLRARGRYKMAAQVFNATKNDEAKLKSLLTMQRIDEFDLELFQLLDMAKPKETDNEGYGVTDEELNKAEAELRKRLDERVVSQLSSKPEDEQPVGPRLLTSPEPGGEADKLGQIPVDAIDTSLKP